MIDLETLSLSTLLRLFNTVEQTRPPLRAFRDKPTAIARVRRELEARQWILRGVREDGTFDVEVQSEQAADPLRAEIERELANESDEPVHPSAIVRDGDAVPPAAELDEARGLETPRPRGRVGRPPADEDDDVILVNTALDRNPKRPGTACWHRYALYRDGMTVREYLDAGGRRGDLIWDRKRGFINTCTRKFYETGEE